MAPAEAPLEQKASGSASIQDDGEAFTSFEPPKAGRDEAKAADTALKSHLVLLVNGLFGNPVNWQVVVQNMQASVDTDGMLIVASNANTLFKTFDGIDRCGERLALEVQQLVLENPGLKKLSIIAHSMGGLIARYLIGKLYEPETGLIAGLRPVHFVSMATPHLGCDGEGPAQVPVIGWSAEWPLGGPKIQKVLQDAAKPFASIVMRKTGAQFFLDDHEEGRPPLLVRLCRDDPAEGYFYSALERFITRTCYANSSGDHLVGWANSSVRHPDELPTLSAPGRGVVVEDDLECAFHHGDNGSASPSAQHTMGASNQPRAATRERRQGQQQAEQPRAFSISANGDKLPRRRREEVVIPSVCEGQASSPQRKSSGQLAPPDPPSVEFVERTDVDAGPELQEDGKCAAPLAEEEVGTCQAAEAVVAGSTESLDMLARLQQLPWRRVDTCFKATRMPFFAHNLIQVTRKWLNWEGEAVAAHLAREFAAMERHPRTQAALSVGSSNSLASSPAG